jgi:hypothetical protein
MIGRLRQPFGGPVTLDPGFRRGDVRDVLDVAPLVMGYQFPGGISGGATPDPIPNSEVKPTRADGTSRASDWESRSLPGSIFRLDKTV